MHENNFRKRQSFKTPHTANDSSSLPTRTSLIWSILVFISNFYTLLSIIYYICTGKMPSQDLIFVNVGVEVLLITELLLRAFLKMKLPKYFPQLNFLHVRKHNETRDWIISLIGSVPISMIYQGLGLVNPKLFSRLMVIKFLRCFEIGFTISKAEEILFYRKFKLLLFLKFMKNVFQLFVITHFAACFWLLAQTDVSSVEFYGVSSTNFFKDNSHYFERMNLTKASDVEKYAHSVSWAVGNLIGSSFKEVTPRAFGEVILSIFMFIFGTIILAKIFSDFASLRDLLNFEEAERKAKLEQALTLCRVLGIRQETQTKIKAYYQLTGEHTEPTNFKEEVDSLPDSLRTDTILNLNSEMIGRTNFFNFGAPAFMMNIAKYMYQQIAMPGDYICKVGEFANDMFFIKKGEVQILSTDNLTQLAILRDGAYFGEIGVLILGRRSVYAKALTVCYLEVIRKEDMLSVLTNFPEHHNLLLKIARQRMKTTKPGDLRQRDDPQSDRAMETPSSAPNDRKSPYAEPEFKLRRSIIGLGSKNSFSDETFLGKVGRAFQLIASTSRDTDLSNINHIVILPTSLFGYFWTGVLLMIVFYDIVLIPFDVAFLSSKTTSCDQVIGLETLDFLVFFIDIIVNAKTAIFENDEWITSKKKILYSYMRDKFFYDLLPLFPFDYIMIVMGLPCSYSYWIKVLRLIKIVRVMDMLKYFKLKTENKIFSVIKYGIIHLLLNHYVACIMYVIANSEYGSGHSYTKLDMFSVINKSTNTEIPFSKQNEFIKYSNFIYWSLSMSSMGPYGDIYGATPVEKLFQSFVILLTRVYFAFVSAKLSHLISSGLSIINQLSQKKLRFEAWLNHVKMPRSIIHRVRQHNDYVLHRYHGLDESEILKNLPPTLRTEIMECLLSDMLRKIAIFPKEDVGLHSNLVHRFKFAMVCQGEEVYHEGETAEEIFFIMEGQVDIVDMNIKIAELIEGDYFGEMAIMNGKIGIRSKTAIASKSSYLAILKLKEIKELWDKYPRIRARIEDKANIRRDENELREISNSFRDNKDNNQQNEKDAEEEASRHSTPLNSQRSNRSRKGPGKALKVFLEKQVINSSRIGPENLQKSTSQVEKNISPLLTKSNSIKAIQGGVIKGNQQLSKFVKKMDGILYGVNTTVQSQSQSMNPALSIGKKQSSKNDSKEGGESSRRLKDANLLKLGTKVKDDYAKKISLHTTDKKGETNQTQAREHTIQTHNRVSFNVLFLNLVFLFKKMIIRFRKIQDCAMFLITLYNVIFVPLVMALPSIQYQGINLAIEVISILCLTMNFATNLLEYKETRSRKIHPQQNENKSNKITKKRHSFLTLCIDLYLIIPFAMAFQLRDFPERGTQFILILIQSCRLFNFKSLTWIFTIEAFQKRFSLATLLFWIYTFILINHIFACGLIMVANGQENFNYTWLAKIPIPQTSYPNNYRLTLDANETTIYTHAIYWAYMTTANIGSSDLSAVDSGEKIYTAVVIMFTTFYFSILFSSLSLLLEDRMPQYQREFENNYRKVLEYIKKHGLESFRQKIYDYYNYIWQDNKGIEENAIVSKLPNSLRFDIFFNRYEHVFIKSKLFKNEHNSINEALIRSFCKKMEIKIYMPNDNILVAGQEANDLYLILDGEIEVINFVDQNLPQLMPGQYFGGIIQNVPQLYNIRPTKVTKIAVLTPDSLAELAEAFPNWLKRFVKHERSFLVAIKAVTTWKENARLKKELASKPIETEKNLAEEKELMGKSLKIITTLRELEKRPAGETRLSVLPRGDSNDASSLAEKLPLESPGLKSQFELLRKKSLSARDSKVDTPVTPLETKPHINPVPIHLLPKFERKSPKFTGRSISKNESPVKDSPKDSKDSPKRATLRSVRSKERVPTLDHLDDYKRQQTRLPTFMYISDDFDGETGKGRNFILRAFKKASIVGNRKSVGLKSNYALNKLTGVLIAKKRLELSNRISYYIHPESQAKMIYEFIHTLMIIYTIFSVPIQVCFDLEMTTALLIIEVIILIEQFAYIILVFRTPIAVRGNFKLYFAVIFNDFKQKGLLVELLSIFPFNMVLGYSKVTSPIVVIEILRLNRVLLITRLQLQLSEFASRYPGAIRILNHLQTFIYMFFVLNFFSCAWFKLQLFNKEEIPSWYTNLDMSGAPLWQKYILSVMFMLSLSTSSGYPEMNVYNNYERGWLIFYIYIGVSLNALAFRMLSLNTSVLSEKFTTIFSRIRKMDQVMTKAHFKKITRDKIEKFFAYSIAHRKTMRTANVALDGLLPRKFLLQMVADQIDPLLNLPFLRDFGNHKLFMLEVINSLRHAVYLPGDYIVYRHSLGKESFMIQEGIVYMLSPNEKGILAELKTGNYFGEFSLYTTTKRSSSFVAGSFVLIYILEKEKFVSILKRYPRLQFEYRLYATQKLEIIKENNPDKAQALLRAVTMNKAENDYDDEDNYLQKILKASETPVFRLKNDKIKKEEGSPIHNKLLSFDSDSFDETGDEKKTETSINSLDSEIDEYVEEDELYQKDIDTKKNTFRIKTKKKERRYSRLKMGREKSVSRGTGLVIKWGINMD